MKSIAVTNWPARCAAAFGICALVLAPGVDTKAVEPPPATGKPAFDLYGDPLPDGASARFGSVRLRHSGLLRACAFSQDSHYFASAAADRTVRIWDPTSGRQLAMITTSTTPQSLAFHQDSLLAVGLGRGKISIYDARTWNPVCNVQLPEAQETPIEGFPGLTTKNYNAVKRMWFSQDGTKLIAAAALGVYVCDPVKGVVIQSFAKAGGVTFCDRTGVLVSMNGDSQTLEFWDVTKNQRISAWSIGKPGHDITAIAFSQDGTRLALGCHRVEAPAVDAEAVAADLQCAWIEVYDFSKHEKLHTLQVGDVQPGHIAFSPNGQQLLACDMTTVGIWDVDNERQVRELGRHHYYVTDGCFSCDSRLVAYVDGNASVLVETERWHEVIDAPTTATLAIAVSPDGGTVAAAGSDYTLRTWDASTMRQNWKRSRPNLHATRISFTPDGKEILTAERGAIGVWDSMSGREVRRIVFSQSYLDLPTDIALREGSDIVAVSARSSIHIADLASGTVVKSLTPASNGTAHVEPDLPRRLSITKPDLQTEIPAIGFSPDGETIAMSVVDRSGARQPFFALWDVQEGFEFAHLDCPPATFVRYSPSGSFVLVGSDPVVAIETASCERVFEVPTISGTPINGRFLPGGMAVFLAAAGRNEGNFRIWNCVSQSSSFEKRGSPPHLTNALLLADSSAVLTGEHDGTLLFWAHCRNEAQHPGAPLRMTQADMNRLWSDLSGDAATAFKAMRALVSANDQAVRFMRGSIHPLTETIVESDVDDLFRCLREDDLATRVRARDSLERLGRNVEHKAIDARRKASAPDEITALDFLLRQCRNPIVRDKNELRLTRVIQVLECIGTPNAQECLIWLAGQPNFARSADRARKALRRLEADRAASPHYGDFK